MVVYIPSYEILFLYPHLYHRCSPCFYKTESSKERLHTMTAYVWIHRSGSSHLFCSQNIFLKQWYLFRGALDVFRQACEE